MQEDGLFSEGMTQTGRPFNMYIKVTAYGLVGSHNGFRKKFSFFSLYCPIHHARNAQLVGLSPRFFQIHFYPQYIK
jgi:hypothetical protein